MRTFNSRPENNAKKRALDRSYRERKGDELRAVRRARRAADAEKHRERARQRYADNREKILSQIKASYARRHVRDPEAVKRKNAEREQRRRANNPTRRINGRMSARVRQSLKGQKNRRSWETLVGYTLADLEARLRQTIPLGYTWEDFLSAELEIDHNRPVASFSFTSAEDAEFRECWALSNLQLLPKLENNRKNAAWPNHAAKLEHHP